MGTSRSKKGVCLHHIMALGLAWWVFRSFISRQARTLVGFREHRHIYFSWYGRVMSFGRLSGPGWADTTWMTGLCRQDNSLSPECWRLVCILTIHTALWDDLVERKGSGVFLDKEVGNNARPPQKSKTV